MSYTIDLIVNFFVVILQKCTGATLEASWYDREWHFTERKDPDKNDEKPEKVERYIVIVTVVHQLTLKKPPASFTYIHSEEILAHLQTVIIRLLGYFMHYLQDSLKGLSKIFNF